MITDFADPCTYVFVLVDDPYRLVVAPYDHRPGPRSAFSDSEVITVTLVAERLGVDEEKAFLGYLRRNHRALFPLLPERTRYNRRRRQSSAATNRIRAALMHLLLRRLTPEEVEWCSIDSLPVPVVGFHHARGDHRRWGEASYGHVASKQLTIFGFKPHLLIAHGGLILDCVLAPAHHADGALTEQLLMDKAWLKVLGAKAYLSAALHALLAAHNDIVLLTPKRVNQPEQHPAWLTHAINHFRHLIETLNSQLAEQFRVECNKAKGLTGLCARLTAKLAAHTIGLYLN